MSYMSKRMRFRNAIEVYEYHTAKYGAPGQERQEKKKATPEQMAKRNRYNRERLARWKLRNNFDVDDYFTRLSYEKDKRPESMEEAKEDWKAFLQILRREYKKRGAELKWMRNIEVGTRGAWHIHIIVNRIPDTDVILAKAWKHGQIQNQLLYQKGEFEKLANYITKTPETDKRLKEANYSASRNLPIPEPEKKVYKLEEKGINLEISLLLKESLENAGYQVIMTRETDQGLYDTSSSSKKAQDMQRRIAFLEEKSPLLTVSIHQNSYQDPSVRGPQVFYYESSLKGKALAEKIQESLNTRLKVLRPRVVKGNTSYYLLKRSKGVLVIVECGFLTNPKEAELLKKKEYQKKVAEAVTEGIRKYIEESAVRSVADKEI